MQRRVLVASLGLRCRFPSWINRPVRIGWYLLASIESKNGKRNKPNIINDSAMRRRFLAFPNWEPTLKQFASSPGCEILEKRDWYYPGLGISRPLLEAFPLGSYPEFKLQHLGLRESCTPPSETPNNYQNDHQIVHFCDGLGRHPTLNPPYMLKAQTQNEWNGTIKKITKLENTKVSKTTTKPAVLGISRRGQKYL